MAVSGRLYQLGFSNVTVSAVQDLFLLLAGASKIVAIQSVSLGQVTNTAVQNLRVRGRYLPTTVTNGSGGSAGTIGRTNPSDAAATATARTNDTTQASTSGTAVDIFDDVWNTVNGFLWLPPIIGRPPIIGLSGAFVLSLDTAPSAGMVSNGTIVFEELP
jgi:hypothetical protein